MVGYQGKSECVDLTNYLRAIITGKESKYNSVDDLKGTAFGISRLGR